MEREGEGRGRGEGEAPKAQKNDRKGEKEEAHKREETKNQEKVHILNTNRECRLHISFKLLCSVDVLLQFMIIYAKSFLQEKG